MQEHLGIAQDCSNSSELELELLQCQLAQAEAALHAERQRAAELQRQVEASQGCAMLTQLELHNSMSRAERLAGLVSQVDQERKGYTCTHAPTYCDVHDNTKGQVCAKTAEYKQGCLADLVSQAEQ